MGCGYQSLNQKLAARSQKLLSKTPKVLTKSADTIINPWSILKSWFGFCIKTLFNV
ncbi:hypothetical protein QWZ13_09955 [Reinekea marina]|uniref:hypothetical protein n=1 Tax=Reinekea marina TaxID=1310421 RepID=UPI0025B487EA|nr:hypothetical protein [Reinekea marina]MDN3649235.1 hypothetical protein [Reinekea marina]